MGKNIMMINPSLNEGGAVKMVITFAEILSDNGFNVTIAAPNGSMRPLLKRANISYIEMHDDIISRNILKKIYYYLLTTIRVLIEVKKKDIHIIFNNSRLLSILCLLVARMGGLKFYSCAHIVFKGKKYVRNLLWGDKVLAVSAAVKEHLIITYNVDAQKIKVIKNTIPAFKPYSSIELDNYKKSLKLNNKRIACNVARFAPSKGHIYLINAWKEVVEAFSDAHLILIGYGELKEEIQDYIQKNGLINHITILPKDANVAITLGISQFFVLPSLREGLPVVILEAFSLGVPVVATDIPGTYEIAKDEYNSILVPPKNVKILAKAIIKIFNDDSLRKYLGENALSTYREKFSFERYESQIVDFFNT